MTISSSYDFTQTRDQVITSAVRLLGIMDAALPYPDELTRHGITLNMMLKSWQLQGIGMWLMREITLFPTKGTSSYSLGSSGAHFTLTPIETTLGADAALGAATITVASATGIVASANIGIELDDGTRQWTTVSGTPSGTTVTLAAVLTGAASEDNTVYVYVTKAQRPLRIIEARWKDSNNETPINIEDRADYVQMPDKTSTGTPSIIYYDQQLTTGVLKLWPAPGSVAQTIVITAAYPISDMDSASDNFELPPEWLLAVTYKLACEIMPTYLDRISNATVIMIEERAKREFNIARNSDSPNSIRFVPGTGE